MFIERDGKTIELTSQEVEQAFRERLKMYEMQDAHYQSEWYLEAHDNIVLLRELSDSDFAIMAERFEDRQDCEIPENAIWEYIVKEYIDEIIEKKGENK
ncbi:MAG: hypothetical protein UH542_08795 [Bacteroidales bacterium]|nr:hypothetical protein [Bacteroidales bacterium]